jgi:hypothetical protein
MRAKAMKTFRPSSSYQLDMPQQICEQCDGRVSSFWLDGRSLLLQLSSYIRGQGEQVGAQARLSDRFAKHDRQWKVWGEKIYPDATIDQATGEFIDENGLLWLHSYIVWPHLTIYSIISGPKDVVRDPENWAIQALKSIRLSAH